MQVTGSLGVDHAQGVRLLLRRAEAAARENHQAEARRLFKAALRHDPTNARALLSLVYLAEDGQASLAYLARLLDAHPHHPQARAAVRWARRRVPTSPTGVLPASLRDAAVRARPAAPRRPRRMVYAFVALAVLVGLGLLWGLGRPPAPPVQAGASNAALPPTLPDPTGQPLLQIIRVAIPLFTPTPPVTPTPQPSPTPTPSSAWVGLVGRPQTKNLSCESRSAADLAGFWGVAVDELEFLTALGQSDNPHAGFVGDVDEPPGSLPPYGYGVYVEPVATTLRAFGLDARPSYDLGLDGLRAELLAGRPVLVWATYGMELHEPVEWTSGDGRVSTVVPFMHTFLVTGFDAEGLTVLDAYDATVQHYPYATFLNAWDLFDQMALLVTGPLG
jgi:uncharacterized protein YvpB